MFEIYEIRTYFEIKPFYEMDLRELMAVLEDEFEKGTIKRNVKGVVFVEDERNVTFLDMYDNSVQHFNRSKCDIIDKITSLKCEYKDDLGLKMKPRRDEEVKYIERECGIKWAARTIN